MNLCGWCPEHHDKAPRDHKKSGRIAMSRHTNSHIYCPQQIRAMNACFGLTQEVILNRNVLPLFFLLCLFYYFLFSKWLACDLRMRSDRGTTRYLCRRPLFLWYCHIVDIAVAHRRYCQDSYYSVPSVIFWRTRRSVPVEKQNITSRRGDQSAISSKEHVKYEVTQTYLSVTYQHDRLNLTGKRPQQRSQGPQQQQSTPPIFLQIVSSGKKNTKRCDTGTNACHSMVSSVDAVYLLRPSRGAA